MGETHDFGFAKWMLRQDTKRYEQQEKNRYRGPHQDEKLVHRKRDYRAKRQPTEREEICAKHICRIQIYPTTQQQNNNHKMSRGLEQTFLRGRGMRGQQAHKQMLHSSDIRETKSEATVRYTSHYENGKCSEAAKAGTEMLEPSRVALGGGGGKGT